MPLEDIEFIRPDWDAPASVQAVCTTTVGGVSKAGYCSLNLATHVDDNPLHVAKNRNLLVEALKLPSEPQWLEQTHSIRVIDLDKVSDRQGDAAITAVAGTVATVLTADCLPVLLCNHQGSEVAAAHAGWRGLLNGVLEQAVNQMHSRPQDVMAWLGPAIGPQQFEVGEDVRQSFVNHQPEVDEFFSENRPGHFLADLYSIARLRLKNMGIRHVSGGEFCTYSQAGCFFSYRRQKITGRQASLIYINK